MGRIISTNSKEICAARVVRVVAHFAFVSSTYYVIVLFATRIRTKLLWNRYAHGGKIYVFVASPKQIHEVFFISREWF